MRIEDADIQAKLATNDLYGLDQVRVVGDNYRRLVVAFETIKEQIGGYVDVRTFLLRLYDIREPRTTRMRPC